jgi:hypothetical protein
MPRILGPDDMLTMTTRLRLVIEDPRQLLSGCVTDYAVEQLRLNGNDPATVVGAGSRSPCLSRRSLNGIPGKRSASQEHEAMMIGDRLEALWAPRVLSVVRVVSALIFMEHGTQKLSELPAEPARTAGRRAVLALRLRRRARNRRRHPARVGAVSPGRSLHSLRRDGIRLLDGPRAAQHLPDPQWRRSPILYCFLFLYLAFAGGGAWSLDRKLWKR